MKAQAYIFAGMQVTVIKKDKPVKEHILDVVLNRYNVTLDQLKSKARFKNIVKARQAYSFFCRKYTNYSLQKIGETTARDHATVLYSARVFEEESKLYLSEKKEREEMDAEIKIIAKINTTHYQEKIDKNTAGFYFDAQANSIKRYQLKKQLEALDVMPQANY